MNGEALILNVDDYDVNRYLRTGLLRKAGYQVHEARGGREALDRIASERPDLVILDVQMPDIDGLEVCRRVRADPAISQTLILHVSATATEKESVVVGLDNGADGYLTDAVDPMVLLATVRALLRLRRAEQERNEARERLAESERRMSRLVDNLSDVVYRVRLDPNFAYEFISPAVTPMTGYGPEEYYRHPDLAWKQVHPEDSVALKAIARMEGDRASLVLRWRCRDGHTIWTEHRVVGLRDSSRRLVALEGVARDITAQKLAEEELRRVNRVKDEFLATLSHELRTPLNAIVGWSQMLQSGKLTPALEERAVDAIARNAMAQRQLINDVLDVSRIVSGKMRLEPRLFDVAGAIRQAVDAVKPAAVAKGLDLEAEGTEAAVPMMGDPDRLQQVFWNLLSNAVKFTPTGGRIDVILRPGESALEIEVRDTGVGIPEWFLPHVFERFSQVDSSMHRRHHGLGLGLALVRHLVELHGGTVRADSQGEGRGTTVTVKLPARLGLTRPVLAGTASPATQQHGRPASARLAGVRVLLVDDDADGRQVIGEQLRQAGAEVSEAESASTALAVLPLLLPDVIISDIGMPEQDGLELMRLVRLLPPESGGGIPAIALTAYGRDEDRAAALQAGYQLHLPKPVPVADLTGHVVRLASGPRPTGSRS